MFGKGVVDIGAARQSMRQSVWLEALVVYGTLLQVTEEVVRASSSSQDWTLLDV